MAIEKDLLDQLLAGRDPKDVFNKDGLVDELKRALSERILNTELDEHLDSDGAEGKSNHRNGDFARRALFDGNKSSRGERSCGCKVRDDTGSPICAVLIPLP